MDFDLADAEKSFQKELEAFLEEHRSPEVMDTNPEQLSQTVETPAKRGLMRKLAEHGWLEVARMLQKKVVSEVDTIGGGTSEIQKNIIARRGLGLPQSY